jgi:SNF family Na+-dependent transporter
VLDYLRDPNSLTTLSITGLISLVIWVALLGIKVFALIDALRYTNNQYVSAGKRSRTLWLELTGLSLAFHLITNVLDLVSLAGTIASIVYLVDVRPALQQVSGRGGNRNNMGPYGPW